MGGSAYVAGRLIPAESCVNTPYHLPPLSAPLLPLASPSWIVAGLPDENQGSAVASRVSVSENIRHKTVRRSVGRRIAPRYGSSLSVTVNLAEKVEA